MGSSKVTPEISTRNFSNSGAQTTKSANKDGDPFCLQMIDILRRLKTQVEEGDCDERFEVKLNCAAAPPTLDVIHRMDGLALSVALVPEKSALSLNAPYQVNAIQVFLVDKERSCDDTLLETVRRGDKGMFAGMKDELQRRLADIVEGEYRVRPATNWLGASYPQYSM